MHVVLTCGQVGVGMGRTGKDAQQVTANAFRSFTGENLTTHDLLAI